FLGQFMTIADEGEIQISGGPSLERALQATKDRPVLKRLTVASLVFRGTVESIQPLETSSEEHEREKKVGEIASEHDPEWQIATIRVAAMLRDGHPGQSVKVLFAASRDIIWYNAPKLKAGQEAVFLAHTPSREETEAHRTPAMSQLLEKGPVYLVTEPHDVLPA